MMRLALVASVASGAVASLSEECKVGLEQLQGHSDVELAAKCRAAFAPEVCREARQHLGAQPWTSERMHESCSRFAAAFAGADVRGLEEAVKAKSPTPQPVETTVAPKREEPQIIAATAQRPSIIGGLVKKLEEAKVAPEGEQPPVVAPTEKPSIIRGLLSKKSKDAKVAHDAETKSAEPEAAESKKSDGGVSKKVKEADVEGKHVATDVNAKAEPVDNAVKDQEKKVEKTAQAVKDQEKNVEEKAQATKDQEKKVQEKVQKLTDATELFELTGQPEPASSWGTFGSVGMAFGASFAVSMVLIARRRSSSHLVASVDLEDAVE